MSLHRDRHSESASESIASGRNSNPASPSNRCLQFLRRAAPLRLVAAAGLSLFAMLTVLIVVRRLAGAFANDITAFGYGTCILLAGLMASSLKIAAEWPAHRLDRRQSRVFGGLLTGLVVCWAGALWTGPLLTWGLLPLAIWLTCVGWFVISQRSATLLQHAIDQVIWPEIVRFLIPDSGSQQSETTDPESRSATPNSDEEGAAQSGHRPAVTLKATLAPASPAAVQNLGPDEESPHDPGLISDLQRLSGDAGGADVLHGRIQAVFAAGARQSVVHVPFIPPFPALPHLECELEDDGDCRLKVGAIFPYGARLELKRTEKSLDLARAVWIEIYATTDNSLRDAA